MPSVHYNYSNNFPCWWYSSCRNGATSVSTSKYQVRLRYRRLRAGSERAARRWHGIFLRYPSMTIAPSSSLNSFIELVVILVYLYLYFCFCSMHSAASKHAEPLFHVRIAIVRCRCSCRQISALGCSHPTDQKIEAPRQPAKIMTGLTSHQKSKLQ